MLKYILTVLFVLKTSVGVSQVICSIQDIQSNELLQDVHVYIKQEKETKVFVTNSSGKITSEIKLNIGDKVKITHIGYETLNVTINAIQSEYRYKLIPLLNELDNIVLTGEILPTSKKESLYDVITITDKEIEKLGAVDATQVLQWENGVQIARDPVLGSSVSINGLSGEHVKIIVDGVEMNGRSDGFVDLEQIQIQEKQSVEVVKGPVSLEYGSNAMGGIVQFISHDEDIRDSIGGNAQILAENTGTYKTAFHIIEAGKKHSLNLYFNRTYFDGWKSDDVFWEGFNAQVADSSRVKNWNPKRFINAKVKYDISLKNMRMTNLVFYQNEQIKEKGFPFVAPLYLRAKDSEVTSHRFFVQSQIKGSFSDHHLYKIIGNAQLYTRYRDTFIKDLSDLSIVPDTKVSDTISYNAYQVRYQAQYMDILNHKIDYGMDVLYDEIVGERIENSKKHQISYGLYIKDKIEVSKLLKLQLGARISYFSTGKTALTPSISSRMDFENGSVAKLSLSRGFRNPGLKDLHFEFIDNNHHIIGNEALKPEQSYHINLGYSKPLNNNIVIDFGGFYNSMSNKIEFIQSVDNANWLTYGNFSKYEGYGGHLDFRKMYSTWGFNIGYQFISDRILEDRVPDNWADNHQISSRIQKTIKAHSTLTVSMKWNSKRYSFRFDQDGNTERFAQDAFTFLDFGYQYNFSRNLNLGFWVKNILDVTSVTGTNETAHSSSTSQQSIARGRMLQMQIRYTL